MRFLSREWLDHMNTLTSAFTPASTSPGAPTVAVSIHQCVTGGPDGDVDYVVRLEGGRVAFEPGSDSRPADVQLISDYPTAVAISRGVLSPASAFAAGRLRVVGSVSALVASQEALAGVGELLAGVAGATTY